MTRFDDQHRLQILILKMMMMMIELQSATQTLCSQTTLHPKTFGEECRPQHQGNGKDGARCNQVNLMKRMTEKRRNRENLRDKV